MNDEAEFLKMINVLARVCDFELDKEVLAVYDKALCPHGYEKITNALKDIFVTRTSRDPFPSIAEILKTARLEVSVKSQADNISSIILATFRKWSTRYCGDPRFYEWFVEHNGELAWAVIQKMGGYNSLYEEWNLTKNLGILRAQIRDAAMSVIELAGVGQLWTPPALPESKNEKLNQLVGSAIKTIGGKNSG